LNGYGRLSFTCYFTAVILQLIRGVLFSGRLDLIIKSSHWAAIIDETTFQPDLTGESGDERKEFY
jgi:hypothetical protein